jgi:16S rRNA (guanine527-N7)-methyltransferase
MRRLTQGLSELGLELSSAQAKQFKLYYQELLEWNTRINLTSITDYEEVQIKHFFDSVTVTLALTKADMDKPNLGIIDIGTGAGFPGLPLKIVLDKSRLVLLDSIGKKAAFLRHISQKLKLTNVEVVTGRAEEVARLPLYRQQFDLVVSRAVALLPTIVELALPFCRIGGKFIAQKKGEISPEIDKAEKAINVLGGKLSQVKRIELREFTDERYLVVIDKINPTPEEYPRRPGMPKRRPI